MEPELIISQRRGYPPYTCEVRLNDEAVTLINSKEILFIKNHQGMRIRNPSFDSNKTYKIYQYLKSTNRRETSLYTARFFINLNKSEDVFGKYYLEKEGDDIFLVKNLN